MLMNRNLPFIMSLVAIISVVALVTVFNGNISGAFTQGSYSRIVHACEDTDPWNLNDKYGVVNFLEDGQKLVMEDECLDKKTLRQFYCRGTQDWGRIGRACANGCEAGICK